MVAGDMAAFLEVRQVSKAYGENKVLRSITFAAEKGEYVTILGPSGAGKSTLLRIFAGFEAPDSGDVRPARPIDPCGRGL